MSNWSFAELRGFIEYKAKVAGIPVIPVYLRNTSRTCPKCGHIEKGNRIARGQFFVPIVWSFRSCGYSRRNLNIATAAKVAWLEVAEKRLPA